ncbi:acetyl/propionyl/methylcrotonyl-CoA carboxylase subunit alpha [Kiloniella laminariae]|uniref:propionyl-CoA carboxylase n=1 Tax=Kiloniella laminariae TaxID=454162 RepID=A0ABT4LPB9_9PROT|nr:acetyl/propionyl/methylcrotonyl-CoA carboxylase subunit alpha [Kiloniella laminariae]MCZ4282980.1 acetyl/propionyl/methylcrotonyl-CoA carboxylase subunit alpha [Kiloniella laminariae]
MFEKILIANRGEIACRVIRTAQRLGIKTVAVYSDADASSLHVKMADEAVRIGPAASAESYLVIDKIIAACKETGAQAVHPGFGFLSENAAFVKALDDAGVVFIGPPTKAIGAMGDKIESKHLAKQSNVSTVPGHMDLIKDAEEAVRISSDIGYPVMIKASAGGGGKGMRVAYNDAEAREGYRSAQNEARSSFGDDRIFIEKFIEEPRHIEIQVIGDKHGNIIHLGERECSIQRRHQKVIEEAPSPFLDEKTRAAMGSEAVALSRAVNYYSAGTVEFIVDKDKNFYFLEMNTRIQVEHPVTELITGIDIVEWMIRVAAGEKLALTQEQVKLEGWAVESRVYAEDPLRNFLPSIGRLVRYQAPEAEGDLNGRPLIRVDSGVEEGSEISMFYDPMIAKLVTYGPDRLSAIKTMRTALDSFYIRGINHNMGFLSTVMSQERFVEGRLTTNYIVEEFPDGFLGIELDKDNLNLLVSVAAVLQTNLSEQIALAAHINGYRGVDIPVELTVFINREGHSVVIDLQDDGYLVSGDDFETLVRGDWAPDQLVFFAEVNGEETVVQVDRQEASLSLTLSGVTVEALVLETRLARYNELMPEKLPPDLSKFLLSPMPGLLVSVAVEEGQTVKAGEELAVIEAMKMENILRAGKDLTVAKISASAGESLVVDQVIIEFE